MADRKLDGKQLGSYRIVQEIGRGAMATVYRALDTDLERVVAIKILHDSFCNDEEFLERFNREAKISAQLDHPNIVHIYSVGREEDINFFAMQFINGGSLYEANKPLELDNCLKTMCDVLAGVAYAHSRRVIHRDLKPDNVMIDEAGRAILMDFGIAKPAGTNLTQTGVSLGTPLYMAPEQITNRVEVSYGADIYACGIMFFELLTGRVPFTGTDAISIGYKHVHEKVPRFADLDCEAPEVLERFILKALEKDPRDRWESAAQMLEVLQRIHRGEIVDVDVRSLEDTDAPRGTVIQPLHVPSRMAVRERVGFTLMVVVLAIAILFGLKALPPVIQSVANESLFAHAQGYEIGSTGSIGRQSPPATKAPVVTKKPPATKAPVVTKKPPATKAPVVTKKPPATKAPVATKKPPATKAPVATKKPPATKAPVATKKPPATKAPVATKKPPATTAPVATKKPLATKAPVATKKPPATKAPVVTKKPPATKAPVATKKPPATKAPVATKKPPATKAVVAKRKTALERGRAFLEKGELMNALAAFEEARKKGRQSSDAVYKAVFVAGKGFLEERRLPQAEISFSWLTERWPKKLSPHFQLVSTLLGRGKLSKGRDCLSAAFASLAPKDVSYWMSVVEPAIKALPSKDRRVLGPAMDEAMVQARKMGMGKDLELLAGKALSLCAWSSPEGHRILAEGARARGNLPDAARNYRAFTEPAQTQEALSHQGDPRGHDREDA